MHFAFLKAATLAVLVHSVWAAPVEERRELKVVKTTTTEHGQVLDWVVAESQGKIASPPPDSMLKKTSEAQNVALVAAMKPKEAGPAGTVPIARPSGPAPAMKRLPEAADHNSTAALEARSYAGTHWYASSAQSVNNGGGTATYSLFKAFVQQTSDFSLLQVAVIRNNAAHANSAPKTQTVESGWINYPDQVGAPHLFTFYTTNNYEAFGDNICGWNRDVAGWVQVDSNIYPGIPLAPLCVIGGAAYEADIGYLLYQGNWWLQVLGKWVGYYPGTLFSQGVSPADTLNDHSDQINFYGEIFNSEDAITTTDMGSGNFPETGFSNSAYMRKLEYYDTTGKYYYNYDGSQGTIISDPNRYRMSASYNSGSDWGSYFYLGGPGAGGVVNG